MPILDAVLALLEAILIAFLEKKVMTFQVKPLFFRLAAEILQLPIALKFRILNGLVQILTLIQPSPRIYALGELNHAAQKPMFTNLSQFSLNLIKLRMQQ
jgi:hypothetical protein